MPYQYNQWAAAGLGKAPTLEIPTARRVSNLPSGSLVPLVKPAILTSSKPTRRIIGRKFLVAPDRPAITPARPITAPHLTVHSGGKFLVNRPNPVTYKKTDKINSALPLAVTPRPVTTGLLPTVRSILLKSVAQPVNSAKPVATLTTTASGQAAVELPRSTAAPANAAAPLFSFDKPVVELQAKPTEQVATEAGAGISPQAQTWLKYGLLAVGVFILSDVFKKQPSVRLKRSR
jgi:hypothetical protein